MQTRFKRLLAGGVAAALLTAVVGGAAFAQTPTPAGTPKVQQRAEEFLTALAGKLGKTPAEVRAAVVATQKDRVAADLAAGRITAEQAARQNQRIDQVGGLGALGGGPGAKAAKGAKPPGPAKAVRGAPLGGELATFLGVQPAELKQALASGKSLAAFAQEKGKSRDDLKAHLTSQHKTQLAQAVTAGKLTQAQADARLAKFTSQLDKLIDRTAPVGKRTPAKRAPRA